MNAAESLNSDLEYLCSLIEQPCEQFVITDALAYVRAVTAISNQIDFFIEDLAENDLSEDQEYVKVSQEQVLMMNVYTEGTDEALRILEETCKISLQSN